MRHIKPIVICVFQHLDRILVNETYDPVKGLRFCRPLGGGINFGETSTDAIVREIREEINAEIENLRFLGTLENIFTYLGNPGHEIVQVYDGDFVQKSVYELGSIPGMESDGRPFQAEWRCLDHFSADRPLVPDGLLKLLRKEKGRAA